MSAYDFTAETLDGAAAPLSDYRGKVLLIVNTATSAVSRRNMRDWRRCSANTPIGDSRSWVFPATSSALRSRATPPRSAHFANSPMTSPFR